jgi:hypothetical protein
MNLFRIPLNVVVVAVLLKMDSMSDMTRFGVCASMCAYGVVVSTILSTSLKHTKKKQE